MSAHDRCTVVVPAKAGAHDHRPGPHGTTSVHGFPLARERRARLSLAAMLACLVLTPGAALPQTGPLTKLRVAYDGFSMTSAPMAYADKTGLFRQFGLDVAPAFVEGGSTLTQAVVGGSVDVAQNGYTPAAAAAVQ